MGVYMTLACLFFSLMFIFKIEEKWQKDVHCDKQWLCIHTGTKPMGKY